MSPTHEPAGFELAVGFLVFISFMTFSFCVASLRGCVDEEKLGKEENASKIVAAYVPPERVLTDAGLRRVRIAKVAIGVFAVLTAVLAIKNIFQ